MGSFFKKQSTVRMIVIVVALLLVVGLVGGVLAATKTSSDTTLAKTVTSSSSSSNSGSSSSSSSNSGSSSSDSGSEVGGGEQYTLTYAMGEYADGGSVPDPVTVEAGSTVYAAAFPTPTRTGYSWIGWSTTDGASVAEYSMMSSIVLNGNITLYPAFIEIVIPEPELVIDNTDGSSAITIKDSDDTTVLTVSAGSTDTLEFEIGEEYTITCDDSISATFTGIYGLMSKESYSCYFDQEGNPKEGISYYYVMRSPEVDGDDASSWTFVSGDYGTIVVVSENF